MISLDILLVPLITWALLSLLPLFRFGIEESKDIRGELAIYSVWIFLISILAYVIALKLAMLAAEGSKYPTFPTFLALFYAILFSLLAFFGRVKVMRKPFGRLVGEIVEEFENLKNEIRGEIKQSREGLKKGKKQGDRAREGGEMPPSDGEGGTGESNESEVVMKPEETGDGSWPREEVFEGEAGEEETAIDGEEHGGGRRGKVLVRNARARPLDYNGDRYGVGAVLWMSVEDAERLGKGGDVEIVTDEPENANQITVEEYLMRPKMQDYPIEEWTTFGRLEKMVRNVPEPFICNLDPEDVTDETPPAQKEYLQWRLIEERRMARVEKLGDFEKYGDWRTLDEESIKEMLGVEWLNWARLRKLTFADQVALALARWDKFRQGPVIIEWGSKLDLLEHSIWTPGDSLALALLKKHKVNPAQLRLMTMMMTSYRPDRDDRHLRKEDGVTFEFFDTCFEDFIGAELPPKRYNTYIKELKPLQRGRLARFYTINGEKYNAIGRDGAFLLTADFPPWDRTGPIHRRKARSAKLACQRMGCFALVTWHGMREVERHLIPKDRSPNNHSRYIPVTMNPDLVIVCPDAVRDPFRADWDKDKILHGEILRNETKNPEKIKTALRKNVDMGYRTVFFVTSWEGALKVREKALEFLEENELPEVVGVGMDSIRKDCLAIIQPIESPTPTRKKKEMLKEEEVIKKAGEALLAGGKISPNRVKGEIYVRVQGPRDKHYHSVGKISEDGWEELEEWREYGMSGYELNRIKNWWPGRMRMAIDIELEKDRKERNIRIDEEEGLIEIGKFFTFELNNETKKYLNELLHEE